MKNLIPLVKFLSDKDISKLLNYSKTAKWKEHYSTKTGVKTPLEFTPVTQEVLDILEDSPIDNLKKNKNIKMMLSRLHPDSIQDWHTDSKQNKRSSVVIHPLTKNYAPLYTRNNMSDGPVILNTQEEHKIINNDNLRINFQICYDEDIEKVKSKWTGYILPMI